MSIDSTTQDKEQYAGTSSTGAVASRRQLQDPPSLKETANDAIECFQHYAEERPDVVAMCCLGVGFVLGWKLKPW